MGGEHSGAANLFSHRLISSVLPKYDVSSHCDITAAAVPLLRIAMKRKDVRSIATLLERVLTNERPGTREDILMSKESRLGGSSDPLLAKLIELFPSGWIRMLQLRVT